VLDICKPTKKNCLYAMAASIKITSNSVYNQLAISHLILHMCSW